MDLNVLIVDDSQTVRAMISKSLRLSGLAVKGCFEASNGRDALSILEARHVDVALVDVNMPVMDGEEMLRRMNADARMRDVPVILLTSQGLSKSIAELQAAHGWEYLRKPVTPEQIHQAITSATEPPEAGRQRWQELFCSLLQQVGFVICEVTEAAEIHFGATEFLRSRVSFHGDKQGEIVIGIPETTCALIASNILGEDPVESGGHKLAQDALAEVSSVLCGHFLSVLAGAGQSLEPDSPVVDTIDRVECEKLLREKETMTFRIEEDPALLAVRTFRKGP